MPTCVPRCADSSLWQAVRLIDGVPKVTELDERIAPRFCAVQQSVLKLDVPVGDAHFVAVVQRQDDLLIEEAAMLLLQPMTVHSEQRQPINTCTIWRNTSNFAGPVHVRSTYKQQ